MDITNERAHRQYPNVQVTGKLDIFLHTVTHYTGKIMVEFQIQCGFKFEFMPFLCGVPVPGRGV